ncbi:helix-turn-helix domain-containing protein [Nocardia sp. NPDC057668]|uniref:helix-turn-helix domain-containing protein n=1 Tax=Nocardia sp. NPDC057668 TaxID=3346202 RepID=UPI003670DF09
MDIDVLPDSCCPAAGSTLWLGTGYAAYLGASLRLDAHFGSVQCLAIGVDAPFTLRVPEFGERTVRSALIPPRRTHQVVARGERMLFCYFDPGSPRAKGCAARMTAQDTEIGLDHEAEAAMIALVSGAGEVDPLRVLDAAGGTSNRPIDDRIADAIAALHANPAAEITAAELAANAHLSTSRFLHLFSAQAGTSFRRYRLWARMLHVGRAVSKASDFTTAAMDAGFASPSHFSDAFHTMCGLTPSALFASGTRLVILDS